LSYASITVSRLDALPDKNDLRRWYACNKIETEKFLAEATVSSFRLALHFSPDP
jgi:hypothetical protein